MTAHDVGPGLDLSSVALVDHHVHGASREDLTRDELETMLTESDRAIPDFMTVFDSQIGLAIRRWCAPVLDLPPHTSPEVYLARRRELGALEVNTRLLAASGIDTFLLETGYRGEVIYGVEDMTRVSGRPVHEVVRIESVLEQVASRLADSADFAEEARRALAAASANAVGLKSIIAYRHGFDFDPARPEENEVRAAAARWLDGIATGADPRLNDLTLLRFGLWTGVDTGLPLQLHAGYGDPDLDLHRCDPLLLTAWLRAVEPSGVDVALLHCYPYHRQAGYLAQVFPHVYFDVGLGTNYSGLRSDAVIAESLELAPFSKLLFSSDAWGPAELHFLGAALWRRGMSRTFSRWVEDGECTAQDAQRIATMIGSGNARRVYRLGDHA